MITAKLQGGLGNQLFQIATAYALARTHGTECAFDFTAPVVHQGRSAINYRDSLYKGLAELPRGWRPRATYKERTTEYRPITFMNGMAISGYFQSEMYFREYRDELKRMFLDEEIVDMLRCNYSQLFRDSVSLHVRRGDYLKFSDCYAPLAEVYYQKAIEYLDGKHRISNIFVFSDDIRWCKDRLSDGRGIFIDGQPDHHDLLMMTLCSHHIIANSSFSWWGAWLGSGNVIAPSKWWLKHNDKDVIPETWVRL